MPLSGGGRSVGWISCGNERNLCCVGQAGAQPAAKEREVCITDQGSISLRLSNKKHWLSCFMALLAKKAARSIARPERSRTAYLTREGSIFEWEDWTGMRALRWVKVTLSGQCLSRDPELGH